MTSQSYFKDVSINEVLFVSLLEKQNVPWNPLICIFKMQCRYGAKIKHLTSCTVAAPNLVTKLCKVNIWRHTSHKDSLQVGHYAVKSDLNESSCLENRTALAWSPWTRGPFFACLGFAAPQSCLAHTGHEEMVRLVEVWSDDGINLKNPNKPKGKMHYLGPSLFTLLPYQAKTRSTLYILK